MWMTSRKRIIWDTRLWSISSAYVGMLFGTCIANKWHGPILMVEIPEAAIVQLLAHLHERDGIDFHIKIRFSANLV